MPREARKKGKLAAKSGARTLFLEEKFLYNNVINKYRDRKEDIMEKFLDLYERYALEGIGLVMILVLILVCIEIHRVNKIKKQMDRVIDKVASYVDAILKEDEPSKMQEIQKEEKKQNESTGRGTKEEAQTRLINSVLEEIFP